MSKLVKIHGTNEFKEHEPLTAQDLVNRTRIHELAAGIQKYEISENQCINIGPIIPAKKNVASQNTYKYLSCIKRKKIGSNENSQMLSVV